MAETASSSAVLEQLQQLLLATIDPRPTVRQTAEQQLLAARSQQLDQFVSSLAALIALQPAEPQTPAQSEELLIAKQIAAVTLKNSISAKVGAPLPLAFSSSDSCSALTRLPREQRELAVFRRQPAMPRPQSAGGVCPTP